MDNDDFDFEFYSEIPHVKDEYAAKTEQTLRELAKGHHDLIGASVAVEELAQRETPFLYRARVVVFIRPDNLAASEKGNAVETALKGALDAITRQVREQREKLRTRWKQP